MNDLMLILHAVLKVVLEIGIPAGVIGVIFFTVKPSINRGGNL